MLKIIVLGAAAGGGFPQWNCNCENCCAARAGNGEAALAGIAVGRRILIHNNNTNPVLLKNSRERKEAERAGWEIAYDGREVAL